MKEKLLERHAFLTESIEKAKIELQQYISNLNAIEGAKQEVEFLLNDPIFLSQEKNDQLEKLIQEEEITQRGSWVTPTEPVLI